MTSALGRRAFLAGGTAAALLGACGEGGGGSDPSAAGRAEGTNAGNERTTTARTSDDDADVGGPSDTVANVETTTTLRPIDFSDLGTCVLIREAAAGPFPLDEQFVRRDIDEDYPGHPLRLGLRVLDEQCEPIDGAAVEVWHCNATGDYSAFLDGGRGTDEGPGTTFCRGTQVANGDGIVEFRTIYPGWYPGRAVHVHLRVRVDGALIVTSQLYFDDAYSAEVYTAAPYADFGSPDTATASDILAGDVVADETVLALSRDGNVGASTTLGLLNLGVRA